MDPYTAHARQKRKPTVSRIQVPQHCHPVIKLLYAEMKRRILKLDDVVERSGVTIFSLKSWRHKTNPTLLAAEAAIGAVDWCFVAVPNENAVPEYIAAELRPIATKLGIEMAEAVKYASLMAFRDHHYGAISTPD